MISNTALYLIALTVAVLIFGLAHVVHVQGHHNQEPAVDCKIVYVASQLAGRHGSWDWKQLRTVPECPGAGLIDSRALQLIDWKG